MKFFLTLIASSFLIGCGATPYQKMGFLGGYKDKPLEGSKHYVEFLANAVSNPFEAESMWHRRASELCNGKEYTYSYYDQSGQKTNTTAVPAGGTFIPMSVTITHIKGEIECAQG